MGVWMRNILQRLAESPVLGNVCCGYGIFRTHCFAGGSMSRGGGWECIVLPHPPSSSVFSLFPVYRQNVTSSHPCLFYASPATMDANPQEPWAKNKPSLSRFWSWQSITASETDTQTLHQCLSMLLNHKTSCLKMKILFQEGWVLPMIHYVPNGMVLLVPRPHVSNLLEEPLNCPEEIPSIRSSL